MKVTVELHGVFGGRSVHKTETVSFRFGTPTVKSALKKAGSAAGVNLIRHISGAMNPVVLINDDRIDLPKDWDTALADGDHVAIIQALGGG